MKIITLFLLKHFLRILALSTAAFVGIYLLIDFFERVSDFIDYKAGLEDYLVYLFNSLPVIFVQILPLAILMTMVLTLGGLGRTNEVTAMRACGISLWKIVQPLMLLALVFSFLLLLLNEFVVPYNAKQLNSLLEIKLKGKQQIGLTRDELWFRDNGRIVNIALAEPAKQTLKGITIFTLDATGHFQSRLDAPLAHYRDGVWLAPQATVRTFAPQSGELLSTNKDQNRVLELSRRPQEFISRELSNNELNFRQLARRAAKLEREGFDATRSQVDMHNRLAAPFTCLIMAFLGVPFALQKGRRSNIAMGIGLSLGIGIVYFILQSLVTAFGYTNALPPILAAWASNFIFLMLGIWMLLSVKQ